MSDEVLASIAISFFILNLTLGTVGFVIGISSNTFDSFEPIKASLEQFSALAPNIADPSRDINAEQAQIRDDFDCNIPIDGGQVPCIQANPLFPLYPPNATSSSGSVNDPIFGIFQPVNF